MTRPKIIRKKTVTLPSGERINARGKFVRGRRGIQKTRPLELPPELMKLVKNRKE